MFFFATKILKLKADDPTDVPAAVNQTAFRHPDL